jgi:hypothetical protein
MDSKPMRLMGSPRSLLVLLLALAFCATIAWTALTLGPFLWHVQQPAAWQGALEAIALAACIYLALRLQALDARLRAALLLLPVAFYLRRHHVDLVLLVALFYIEGLLALGALLRRGLRDAAAHDDWLRNFIAGVALLACVLWLAQLAAFGLPRTQRLLAFAILAPALVLRWRHCASVDLLRRTWRLDGAAAAWAAVAIALVLVAFARTNTVEGLDPLWYGLRPELVLVGAQSVFDPLGFASPVYYFPKLYEVLVLPLSAMRESSVVQGASILFGALLARLLFDFARRLGASRELALGGSVAIWTIPAFANSALDAKPDVFTALLVVAMVWFAWGVRAGRRADFCWLLACAALAVSSKLVAIPYVAAAGLASLFALFAARHDAVPTPRRAAVVVLASSTLVAVLACVRTWLVSGMPTIGPDPLVALWQAMGMSALPWVGTLEWTRPQVWSDLPAIAVGWLAYPSLFSHLQISWPGNIWLFLPLAALMLARRRVQSAAPTALLLAVPAMGLALLMLVAFTNRGGDGNYFIAPVVLASVVGLAMAARACGDAAQVRALHLALALFTTLHFAYGFVSASWSVGTRPWDLDFTRSNRDSPDERSARLASEHLAGVEKTLRDLGSRMRLTGYVASGAGFWLPARYEDLTEIVISHMASGSPLPVSREMLACGGIAAMLIPQDAAQLSPYGQVNDLVTWARALPSTFDLHADERWRMIDLRSHLPRCPYASASNHQHAGPASQGQAMSPAAAAGPIRPARAGAPR